ncbi:ABC transporter permease [Streptosporangium longisporum]|uniref:ABC transmembrane type-1 domain-containing protein n=1 Tax=Streptosporangium longisporum TaxID=46187 RepID=A0ABN3Y7U4_9ACTN
MKPGDAEPGGVGPGGVEPGGVGPGGVDLATVNAGTPGLRASARAARRLDREDASAMRSPWLRPLGVIGLVILALFLFLAIAAPLVAPYDPIAQDSMKLLPPSAEHWFGTDQIGRDVFSRVIYGARLSLPVALLLVAVACAVGTLLGAIAGYFGGWAEGLIMRSADLVFAFPGIILAMAVVAALGPDLVNAVLAVVIVSWPAYSRVVRGMILSMREENYVHASRLLGASSLRTLWVDVRPGVVGPIVVLAALDVGNAVLTLSGLSFLGLGARPPVAEWGSMVASGAQYFDKWWLGVFPGLAILLVVLAANFLGDTVRDVLDPRSARRGRA